MLWLGAHTPLILTLILLAVAVALLWWQQMHHQTHQSTASPAGIIAAGALAVTVSIACVLTYWASGRSNPSLIGGILPWNDAMGYLVCAQNMVDTGTFNAFCQRRPIYTALLASLEVIAGRNLQIVYLLQAGLFGFGAFLLARSIDRSLGRVAALTTFAILFLYAENFTITTLTENAGLLFGIMAMLFLWRGASDAKLSFISIGLFLLTLGLNARAGAFFILPALIVWLTIFHSDFNVRRLTAFAIPTAAVVTGFLVNWALLLGIDGNTQMAHSNFSYVLYGLSVGGKGWLQVYTDHPEIFQSGGGVPETQRIYEAAVDNIIHQPQLLLWGLIRGGAHYFYAHFRYIEFFPLRLVVIILWGLGIAAAFMGRKDRPMTLLLAGAAGIAVSAPFITWDGGSRIYAATFPFDAVIAALGLIWLGKTIFQRNISPATISPAPLGDSTPPPSIWAPALFSAALVFLVFPFPFLLPDMAALPPLAGDSCDNGRKQVILRPGLETPYLHLARPGEESLYPLSIPVDGFRGHMDKWVHKKDILKKLPEGSLLLAGYQRQKENFTKNAFFLVEDVAVPPWGEVVRLCVGNRTLAGDSSVSIAESITVIPGP